MTKTEAQTAPGVPARATQGAEAHKDWTEASVWTQRMVLALENGVKGGCWYSLMDQLIRRRLRSILLRQTTKQSVFGMSRAIHQRWPTSSFAHAGLLALHTAWLNARYSR